jgi:hypothetical protein
MAIRKRGSKFVLVARSGRVLGTHPSRKAAEKQEVAISLAKARKKGHRIPKK